MPIASPEKIGQAQAIEIAPTLAIVEIQPTAMEPEQVTPVEPVNQELRSAALSLGHVISYMRPGPGSRFGSGSANSVCFVRHYQIKLRS